MLSGYYLLHFIFVYSFFSCPHLLYEKKILVFNNFVNTEPSDDSEKLWTSTSLEMAKGKTVC